MVQIDTPKFIVGFEEQDFSIKNYAIWLYLTKQMRVHLLINI